VRPLAHRHRFRSVSLPVSSNFDPSFIGFDELDEAMAVLRSCNGGGFHMHRVAGDEGIDSLQSVNDSRILVATVLVSKVQSLLLLY
jgi:hypothetical protein